MTEMLRGVAEMIMGSMKTKVLSNVVLSKDAQSLINKLINEFMHSSLRCQSMTYYFKNAEKSLFGVADLHLWSSASDAMWARSLIEYMNMRGGHVVLDTLEVPECENWGNVVTSFECMLRGKQQTYQTLLQLYKIGHKNSADPHLCEFIEANLSRPMGNMIRKLGILYSQACLACEESGVGEYLFNKDCEKNLLKIMMVNKLVRPDKYSIVY